jgi:hypothetical protein
MVGSLTSVHRLKEKSGITEDLIRAPTTTGTRDPEGRAL